MDFSKENNFEACIVKSVDVAKEFNFYKNPDHYPIYFFETNTSGEKTYEEFYTEHEDYTIDKYDSLGFIKSSDKTIRFKEVMNDFNFLFSTNNCTKLEVVNTLKKYVPDFVHIETGKHLDQKM